MQDVRKQDPTFTNFVPKTAAEAVDRFVRCRKNGLKPMLVPECLIACAGGLKGTELDKFEDWIINPNADLDNVELVPFDSVRLANDAVYQTNLLKHTTPPLPADDDEKMPLLQTWSTSEALDRVTESGRDSLDLSTLGL